MISSVGGGVYSAIGVGMHFMHDGINIACTADSPVARTAIGIKPGGREIVVVTVRGWPIDPRTGVYSGRGGMTVRDMSAFMRSLGMYNAVMLDGGGSTILVTKHGTSYKQLEPNPPPYTRPVSNSFAIWRR